MADTAETYKGEFYCVKCKAKREAEGRVVETNGRRMAKGTCPVCGTTSGGGCRGATTCGRRCGTGSTRLCDPRGDLYFGGSHGVGSSSG